MVRRRTRPSRLVALVAALAAAATLAACDPPPEPPGSTLIPCSAKDQRLVLTVSSHLDPSCTYTAGFEITASNVTLDCRGALVETPGTPAGAGILIHTPVETAMSNVTVRNCTVSGGWVNSLKITRDGFRFLEDDHEFENPMSAITIEKSTFRNSRGVGIFVDGYTSGVSILRNTVFNAGSSGIYLETGSKGTLVEGNHVDHNGFIENGANGKAFSFGGTNFWFWGPGREGLSVDGAYENTIRGNVFNGNSAGGIFLYKNCGEYPDRNPGRWFERRDPANDNLIEGNVFNGGRNGIWVGARNGENMLPMECSDPKYVDTALEERVLDPAKDNTLRNNHFLDVTYGIRIEDDGTTVEGNQFRSTNPAHHAVIVGTPQRTTILGLPVARTVLRGNVSSIPGNAHPYRWVFGHVDTNQQDNTALGQLVTLCEGREPARGPFVMTIAVKVANPDGSMPTPPANLSLPDLGVLPACGAATGTAAQGAPAPATADVAALPDDVAAALAG